MLIWNHAHSLYALCEFEMDQVTPLQPAPEPITGSADIVDLNVRRRDRLGGILHEYERAA